MIKVTILILLLFALQSQSWDVEFVSQKLALTVANLSQELLYCVCTQCFDERLDLLMQWLQESTLHPQLVLSTRTDFQLRNGDHKRNMYTLVLARTPNDFVFQVQDRILRGRHFYLNTVIMVEPIKDFAVVEAVLHKMQRGKFVNTDVYYRNATTGASVVYGFSNYPQFTLQNRTHWIEMQQQRFYYKLFENLDLQGYAVFTPIQQDAPKVIKYTGRSGRSYVQGTSYNILKIFVKYINGTLLEQLSHHNKDDDTDDSSDIVNMSNMLQMVRMGEIQITAHAYALFTIDELIDKSYPLLVTNWCLMVPITNRVSTLYYPFLPFDALVWLIALGIFFCLNLLYYSAVAVQHFDAKRNFFLKNFCQFINITPAYTIHANSWLYMFINTCCFGYGFFLSAFYTSMLGSLLTVTLFHTQINTIEDLISAELPVMIIDYELQFLLSEHLDLPSNFLNLLRPSDPATFYKHQFAFNTSFAYFVTSDDWRFLNLQQRYFHRPIFKFSSICFGAYHQAFPIEPDSPLWRELEYFLYRIHSSGMHRYHASKSFDYALRAGLVHHFTETAEFTTVGIQHLRIVFLILIFNLFVAFCCFLLEYFKYKFTLCIT